MEKTLDIQLQELREQIAQDIENLEPKAADFIDTLKGKYWVARCASIARGEHK